MKTKYHILKHLAVIAVVVSMLFSAMTSYAFCASKTLNTNRKFVGYHNDFGASVWRIDFNIDVNYKNTKKPYEATHISTHATMYPRHTYGTGKIILGGLKEKVDSGSWTLRKIKPTPSAFWSDLPMIVPTGTKVYFALQGSTSRYFSTSYKQKGEFTYYVSNVTFVNPPTCSMTLTINVP